MNKFKKVLFSTMFWLVSLTWGILLTIPGLIMGCIAILLGGKPHRNGCTFIVEIGRNWGGFSLGPVALCCESSLDDVAWYTHTRAHEFGHSIEHLILGPLHLFLVIIPSAIRYWCLRKFGYRHSYDYAIFEYTASKWGYYWMKKLDNRFYFVYNYSRKDLK